MCDVSVTYSPYSAAILYGSVNIISLTLFFHLLGEKKGNYTRWEGGGYSFCRKTGLVYNKVKRRGAKSTKQDVLKFLKRMFFEATPSIASSSLWKGKYPLAIVNIKIPRLFLRSKCVGDVAGHHAVMFSYSSLSFFSRVFFCRQSKMLTRYKDTKAAEAVKQEENKGTKGQQQHHTAE